MADDEMKTMLDLFLYRVRQNPERTTLSFVGEEGFTRRQTEEHVAAFSEYLREQGIKKGDKVALLSENSPQWGIAYLAVCTMGAIIVPILPDFHKSEVHHILRNCGSKILCMSSSLFHKVEEVEFKEIKKIIFIDSNERQHKAHETESLNDIITNERIEKGKKAFEKVEIDEDDLLEILYTSGTTGHSKGVMLTHKNIVSNIFSVLKVIDINENDRLLSLLPLAHSYECSMGFLAAFYTGAKIDYIKGLPTAPTVLSAVAQVKPTIILSVPLIMDKIYKKKVIPQINAKFYSKAMYNVKSTKKLVHRIAGKKLFESFGGELKVMVFGGAAMPPDVEDFLIEGNFPFVCGYGLSETAPVLCASPIGKHKARSAGKFIPGVEYKIDDGDPDTGVGEILVKGPNVMKGYYKNEEETEKTFTEDGWLITGDRGYADEEDYLFIKGRSKNLIVGPSGENIYPEEIEFHLSQNPFVLESLVFEKDGRIVARVFLDYEKIDQEYSTSTSDESKASRRVQKILFELREEVNSKLASYSRIHKIIEQPEEFVKTPTKKIKRYLYTS